MKLKDDKNIILIGMPTSGKTTISTRLGERLHKKVLHMDSMIEEELGMSIRECFRQYGEDYFRDAETELIRRICTCRDCVIACGGGVIKREENMKMLSDCGIVFLLRRDFSLLFPTEDRPLSSTREDLEKLYRERKELYRKYNDHVVINDGSVDETVDEIIRILRQEYQEKER